MSPVPNTSNTARPKAAGFTYQVGSLYLRAGNGGVVQRAAAQEAPKFDTAQNPEDLSAERGRTFSRPDFTGGEGLDQAHGKNPPVNVDSRYFDSRNVEVRRAKSGQRREITLLHTTASVEATTNTRLPLVWDGTNLWTAEGTVLRSTSDPLAAAPSWANADPHAGQAAVTCTDLASLGSVVYAALGASGIHRNPSGTWAHWSDLAATKVWAVKRRIVASTGVALATAAAAAGSTTHITLDTGLEWRDVCDAGMAVLAGASDGRVYALSLNSSDVLTLAGETLFPGEEIVSVAAQANVVLVGTRRSGSGSGWIGRLYSAVLVGSESKFVLDDIQLVREWGDSSTTVDRSPNRIVFHGDSAFTLVRDEARGECQWWRYDLVTTGMFRWWTVAAEDVTDDLVFIGDRAFCTVSAVGVFRQTGTRAAAGWLIGPAGDFANPGQKAWVGGRLDVGDVASGESVKLSYSTVLEALTDDSHSSWTEVVEITAGRNESELALSNVTSRYLLGKVDLTGPGSSAPTVRSFGFRGFLAATDVEMPMLVQVGDVIERPGRKPLRVVGYGQTLYAELRRLEGQAVTATNLRTDDTIRGQVTELSLPMQGFTARGFPTTVARVVVVGQRPAAATPLADIAVAHESSPFISVYPWTAGTGFGTKYADPATLPVGTGTSAAFSPSGADIAVAHNTTPFISVYPWATGTGFGTKYSNPATLPAGTGFGQGVAFSPSGADIAVAHNTTPFISVYPWTTGTGFGTKYANPATLPTHNGRVVAFSPSGADIAVAHESSPFVTVYPWTAGTGFGTKYADPATLPTGNGRGVAFSPSGADIAVAHLTSPFISVYPWATGTGFGTKYSNPATLPTGDGQGVAFSPSGADIAVAHDTTPFISVYPWTAGTGFGTKYSNPATLPAGNATRAAFSPSRTGGDIAVAHSTSPFISVYPWTAGTGFGTKYSNPATLPTSSAFGAVFSLPRPGADIAVTHLSGPFISVYPWTAGTGFGTKYSNPATLPVGTGYNAAFSPSGADIAVAHDTTPFISVYPWTAGTGFGTKYADPATLPTSSAVGGVAFSPSGADIAVAHNTTPFISVYPWATGTGFGTKYSNPATLPTGLGQGVAFSPSGADIAVTHNTTPFISVYPWTAGTGFGTKYADPATLPTGDGRGVAFSPSGADIAVTHNLSPFVTVYPWTAGTGFGTKYADPATLPTGTGFNAAFSPSGADIAVAHNTTPFISVYPWTAGTGFGTKYADPATLPAGFGNGVAFSPSGADIAVAHSTSPFISVYPWTAGTGFGTKYSNPATLPTGTGSNIAFAAT